VILGRSRTIQLMPPRITIVTPSYNQAAFLEETIRSVLDQGYPNLEYLVVDGGSTDGSVEIIRRFADRLTHWESCKDRGQSDAINKGFARATGDIMGWINSDDMLAPGALGALAEAYRPGLRWYYGRWGAIWADGSTSRPDEVDPVPVWKFWDFLFDGAVITQVATFWNRELWQEVGSQVLDHPLIMDYELWMRFARLVPSTQVQACLGIYREHPAAKTGTSEGKKRYRSAKQRFRFATLRTELSGAVSRGDLGQAARLLRGCLRPFGRIIKRSSGRK